MKSVPKSVRKIEKGNFTIKKFVHTGREILVELRSSLHTKQGIGGLTLFCIGILWGVYLVMCDSEEFDPAKVIVPVMWCMMGLSMMINLQNHKLLYLLPVSRKEFAAGQIRKMLWVMAVTLAVLMFYFALVTQDVKNFWMITVWKLIPTSACLSIYQVTSVRPVKGSETVGTNIYQLSWGKMLACIGAGLLNFVVMIKTWSPFHMILPILSYGADIYATFYFYRKISCSDFYYDEL